MNSPRVIRITASTATVPYLPGPVAKSPSSCTYWQSRNRTAWRPRWCPHGVLYRSGAEGRIRRGMVEDDVLEAVIGLPPYLFFGNSVPVAICVFNRAKSESRRERNLFVDAAQDGYYQLGRGRNHLDPEHVDRIVAAYRTFEDDGGFTHVADVGEIAANDYNLNINRYVDTAERAALPSVADALTRVRDAERRHAVAVAEMDSLLVTLGLTADR